MFGYANLKKEKKKLHATNPNFNSDSRQPENYVWLLKKESSETKDRVKFKIKAMEKALLLN